jgi:hypothetical protein
MKTMKKELVNANFPKIISMVEEGYNISVALKKLGIDRGTFYKCITKEQRAELRLVKTSNAIYGIAWKCHKKV